VTPAEIITEARKLIQDTSSPYRYSDDSLLGYVNQALKRMALLRPDLFAFIGSISTTADTTVQSCPTDSVRLIEIFRVVGGKAVTEVSRETMDQSTPNWVAATSGSPVNYMRHPRNPNRFFLYPPPTSGTTLEAEYVQSPPTYTSGQTIGLLPDSYLPVVVDGVVFLSESEDNEHVSSGRSKMFQEMFNSELAVGQNNRVITDAENSGIDNRKYSADSATVVE
tara:strand:- start:1152 stop:1820 length:669 start_codon:yes stop_codon:yes gene_type:complete